jgi:hypothetical protein
MRKHVFSTANPKEKQQKAIPACVIAKIAKQKLTELQRAISQLTILACFCHAFMRVRQSPTTQKTTNQNPLPPKPLILQKRLARQPQ